MAETRDKPGKPDKQAESRPRTRTAEGRFVAGKSGNPKGRPKNDACLTTLLREAMESRSVDGVTIPPGMTVIQALVVKALNEAISGNDFRYFKEVWDRIDGKVPDRIAGHDGGPAVSESIESRIARVYGKPDPDPGPDRPAD